MAFNYLKSCIDRIWQWLLLHYLAINDSKTKTFVTLTPQELNKLNNIKIKVDNSSIQPSLKICNLGITFDSKMTFHDHINCIYRKSMF